MSAVDIAPWVAVSEETMGIDEDEDDWLNDADWLLPPMSGALEEDGSQDDVSALLTPSRPVLV